MKEHEFQALDSLADAIDVQCDAWLSLGALKPATYVRVKTDR
jgi:hypothetical protein